jgi:hypothetical protein
MTARAHAVALPRMRLPNRVIPDTPVNAAKSRAWLVLILTPTLIFFMARKPADRASAAPRAYEQWPPAHHALVHSHLAAASYNLDPHGANLVYSRAMLLARNYDSRPYWKYSKFTAGEPTNRATADLAIEHLIPCESMGRPINRVDTNGKMSYGILQFQDWDEWERVSGITGDPDNRRDAIRMAEWAIENGMINHWTCATTLKML